MDVQPNQAGAAAYEADPIPASLRGAGEALDHFATHTLKVEPPYFEEVLRGRKPFEVRKNDRGYQRGDLLILNEWDRDHGLTDWARYTKRKAVRWVTFVYSGDPRFGGVEPGYVVLGLGEDDYTRSLESL